MEATSKIPVNAGASSYSRPADTLLSKLQRVYSRGQGSWSACCPAHDDDSPSLSIRETSDGTLLLYCHSGCDVYSIVKAVGLELSDLFPHGDKDDYGKRSRVRAPSFPWADMIRALHEDLLVVQIGAACMARGDHLASDDLNALARAALKISTLIEQAGGAMSAEEVGREIRANIKKEEELQ